MSTPGFIEIDQTVSGQHYRARTLAAPDNGKVRPAACAWWDRIYAPVACWFVDINETYGIPGYGPSPCASYQIPFDPAGCAALPRSRNRF